MKKDISNHIEESVKLATNEVMLKSKAFILYAIDDDQNFTVVRYLNNLAGKDSEVLKFLQEVTEAHAKGVIDVLTNLY